MANTICTLSHYSFFLPARHLNYTSNYQLTIDAGDVGSFARCPTWLGWMPELTKEKAGAFLFSSHLMWPNTLQYRL